MVFFIKGIDHLGITELEDDRIQGLIHTKQEAGGQDHGSAEEQHVIKGRDLIFCG